MNLKQQFENILREAGRKAVPIEYVRDALYEAVEKSNKYSSICLDCMRRVPNGELCKCHKEKEKNKADGFIGESMKVNKKPTSKKCKHNWRYLKDKSYIGSSEAWFYCTKCLEIERKSF